MDAVISGLILISFLMGRSRSKECGDPAGHAIQRELYYEVSLWVMGPPEAGQDTRDPCPALCENADPWSLLGFRLRLSVFGRNPNYW